MPDTPAGSTGGTPPAGTGPMAGASTSPLEGGRPSSVLSDGAQIELITEADKQLFVLLRSHLDLIADVGGLLQQIKETLTADIINNLSVEVKVFLRAYLTDKGCVFVPGMHVNAALLGLLEDSVPFAPAALPLAPLPMSTAISQDPRVRPAPLPPPSLDQVTEMLNSNSYGHMPTRSRAGASSSLGRLPQLRNFRPADPKSLAATSQLLKIYSHPAQQFKGKGLMTENLASFQRSYMYKCKTLGVTEQEAFDNLHVLFVPDSPASLYYHQSVQPVARSLEHAFQLLFERFSSPERRDRLINAWNNLQFSEFKSKPGATNQTALSDLSQTARILQLQLGEAYQSDVHLRDVLKKAVQNEPFATFIALSNTSTASQMEEVIGNAISVVERQQVISRSRFSSSSGALKDTLYSKGEHRPMSFGKGKEQSEPSDRADNYPRRGMALRRYGGGSSRFRSSQRSWTPRRSDGKNPIRNNCRLLCRQCHSDTHLIRDCPEVAEERKVHWAKSVLCIESSPGEDEIEDALEMIQDFDDTAWNDFEREHAHSEPINDPDETSAEVFFIDAHTSSDTVPLARDYRAEAYRYMADRAVSHSLLRTIPSSAQIEHSEILYSSHSKLSKFEGICMDDGAETSVSGLPAFRRYCAHAKASPQLSPSSFGFSMGGAVYNSMGKACIRFPVDSTGNFLEYETDVVDASIPMLLGLRTMKSLKWYVNEITDRFCSHEHPSLSAPLVYKHGHLYLEWPLSSILYTRSELLKLHRRFAHPSTGKLCNLLRRAAPQSWTPSTRRLLEDIAARCNSCQRMAPRPYLFSVTMPDKIIFNHEIYMDLMWLEKRPNPPVLHIVDRGTHFSAALFLEGERALDVWNAFLRCWVNVYIGFPNIISHDQGSLFVSEEFRLSLSSFGIAAKESPTESHNSLGPGERYHAPLRRIYQKIKIEHPSLTPETLLSTAVHGLNNTANPDGLIPTLLVFGALPKLPLGNVPHLPPQQQERFAAIETSRKAMETIVCQQRLKLAQAPRTKSMDAFKVPPGSDVLVYLEKKRCWEGPYELKKYDNYKTVWVDVDGYIKPYSIASVKPYLKESEQNEDTIDLTRSPSSSEDTVKDNRSGSSSPKEDQNSSASTAPKPTKPAQNRRLPWMSSDEVESPIDSVVSFIQNQVGRDENSPPPAMASIYSTIVTGPNISDFEEADRHELQGLLDRQTYSIVNKSDIPSTATILKGRMVRTIKHDVHGNMTRKSRLVIQGHLDPEKEFVVNEAPTLLRSSVRIIISLQLAYGFRLWTRDVKQAYVQSDAALERDLYIRLPPSRPGSPAMLGSIGHFDKNYLRAIKPLYGLSESPGFWWQTFRQYHVVDLGMKQSILDPCLFFKRKNSELTGLVGTLVDDTLGAGASSFSDEEKEKCTRFDVKDREDDLPFMFNGAEVDETSQGIKIHQQTYSKTLKKISPSRFTEKEFGHLKGQVAYIATHTRPDVNFISAQLSQVKNTDATPEHARLLNSAVSHMVKHPRGITFSRLDMETAKVCGYSDASFANNHDNSSQLGMVVVLVDDSGSACPIHFASWKCRRVTRSVLAAEVCALSACFDFSFTIRQDLEVMTGIRLPLHLFTDSMSIFDTVTKLSSLSEKRLLIDISAIRQAYVSGEIQNLGHISSEYNIADPLTKKMNCPLLNMLLDTARLCHPVNKWIVHREETNS